MRLIPREEKFYDDFTKMADMLREGAALLQTMFASEPPTAEQARVIKDLEHKCDATTHDIIQRLNRTFVTPIDREDIYALASELDDVMDAIDAAAALLPLYRITTTRPRAQELCRLIGLQTEELRHAVVALEKKTGVLEHTKRINDFEHEADLEHQRAVGELFDQEKDPIALIKWKEIFDVLEAATDDAEDVANLLENIVVKHG